MTTTTASPDRVAAHGRSRAPLAELTPPVATIPAGAVDCHAHVIDPARFPPLAGASYVPAPAPAPAYLDMLAQTGMARGVLVQTSIYGTDNRCMQSLLRMQPGRLRGVAVVDETVSDDALRVLHDDGVRGVRFNAMFAQGTPLAALPAIAARIAPLGWHVELLVDAAQLPGLAPTLRRLPVPVVVAHVGYQPVARPASEGFDALLDLLRDPRFWVKLSGFNRLVADGQPFAAVAPRLRAVLDAAPDRAVWGSDWPHVACDAMPDTGALLNTLVEAVADATLLRRVLADNPCRLYDFEPIPSLVTAPEAA
jgi:2-pyrone-4,6-dicarboxylate lactonase